jgi:hypothetical protein
MEYIQENVGSNKEQHEKLSAIEIIDNLIDLNYEDTRKITRFSNYLRNALSNSHNDSLVSEQVSKTLGKLAKTSSTSSSKTLTAEFVEFESKRGKVLKIKFSVGMVRR